MLTILKENKKKIVEINKVINRKNLIAKGTGLMFHKKIKNEAHIFYFQKPQRTHLTMLFVFFPIDVLFINNNEIIELKQNFKPFTNYYSKEKANKVIELPNEFIKKHNIKIGHKILIQD